MLCIRFRKISIYSVHYNIHSNLILMIKTIGHIFTREHQSFEDKMNTRFSGTVQENNLNSPYFEIITNIQTYIYYISFLIYGALNQNNVQSQKINLSVNAVYDSIFNVYRRLGSTDCQDFVKPITPWYQAHAITRTRQLKEIPSFDQKKLILVQMSIFSFQSCSHLAAIQNYKKKN